MKPFKIIICIVSALIILGCGATAKSTFVNEATALSDTDICYNFIEDIEMLRSIDEIHEPLLKIYARKLHDEITRRRLSETDCLREISRQRRNNTAVAVAVVLAGALVYAIYKDNKKGRRKYTSASNYPTTRKNKNQLNKDTPPASTFTLAYDWDEFYDMSGERVFRCRSKKTGKFLPDETCGLLYKDDNTWPTKFYLNKR